MKKCNLGGYKTLVEMANKCGGPLTFVLGMLATGYGVGKVVELGINTVRKGKNASEKTYSFSKPSTINNMQLDAGDQFSIIVTIKDVAIIKLLKDCKKPYVVSLNYLKTVSSDLAEDFGAPSNNNK